MKISVITAVYNRVGTIREAVESVQTQSHNDVEHIIIDGASTDGTLEVLSLCLSMSTRLLSEKDKGIYDALNKGLRLASGDIVGFMHSDDFFADSSVLAEVANAFSDPEVMAVYGDLQYVDKVDTDRVIRHWKSGVFTPERLRFGWMPPHPTLYVRRSVVEKLGGFDTSFKIAADYDSVLRYFSSASFKVKYIPRVLVKMRVGGESNRSLSRILTKTGEDYRALRQNGVGGVVALFLKNVSKIGQFI